MSSADRQPHILGVGLACLDHLFLAPPAGPDGAGPVRDHLTQGGGLIGTALVAAARLGASTQVWTWVGDDPEGESVLAGLRQEGVDISEAEVIRGARTPVSFIHVEEESGQRTIFHGPRLDVPSSAIAALSRRRFSCDVLLVDAIWPEASLLAAAGARRQDTPVVGDFCPNEALADLAASVTALIVPRTCGERLAPRASWDARLRTLARTGPTFVAITAGAEGCYYLDEFGRLAHQPGFSVPVADTTGAGDVFHGAFAYALGRRRPRSHAVEFASAAAALNCRALGGRTAIPTRDETLDLLRSSGSSHWSE